MSCPLRKEVAMAILGAIAVPHPPLIVPAVGRGEEARIQATIDAYYQATEQLLARKPDVLVISSPHAPLFRDGFHVTTDARLLGDMSRFRAPNERISAACDESLAREIVIRANAAGIPAVGSDRYRDDMDHGTYVPLYFVREAYRTAHPEAAADLPCPIVRIGLSGLSPNTHRALGRIITEASDALGKRVAFIASGDLSHVLKDDGPYGFEPEGPRFDAEVTAAMDAGDFMRFLTFDEAFCDNAAECGLRSFQIMAGALEGLAVSTRMLSNEGPFGVGYGVATCAVTAPEA
jgi:aromatic ring-opening dioxygenase LigB subunit